MTAPATSGGAEGSPVRTAAVTGAPGAGAGPLSRSVLQLIVAVCCLGSVAAIVRALLVVDDGGLRLWYIGLGGLTTLLCVLTLVRTPGRRWEVHALLAVQCLLVTVLTLLSRGTYVDFLVSLFIPLAAEAAVVFAGRPLRLWVGVVAALSAVLPLILLEDPRDGLTEASLTLALVAVLTAYVVVARDLETARRQSQGMLDDLRTAGAQLEAHAARAGELAAVAERDRVARDLNDSVAARIDGIVAAAEAAQRRLGAAPAALEQTGEQAAAPGAPATGPDSEAADLLAAIQGDTQQALAQMRGLIAELRPATA